MKRYLIPFLTAATMATSSHAATYSSDFENPPYPPSGSDFNGVDGWFTINALSGVAFIATTTSTNPNIADSNAGAIGGVFNVPATTGTAFVKQNYAVPIGFVSYSLDISLIDSDRDFPIRDNFGITLSSGSDNLFTLHFTPQDPFPADPVAETNALWDLSYSVGVGPTIDLNLAVFERGFNSLLFEFSPNANGTQTNLFFMAGSDNVVTRDVVLNLDPAATTSDFGFSWTPTNSAEPGNNYLTFDNINIVPEPSSALLLGLAGLAFVGRRKRD